MPEIVLTHVTKRWDKFYAVDDLNLVIDDNAFVTLLGPSGCGKTTTLRMIAGLETPTSGRITIGGRVVYDSEAGINIPPNKRKVGFLFQNYALWPNMTCLRELSLFMLLCVQGFILSTTLDYFDEMGLYAFSSGINLILIVTILICNTLVNKVTGASLDKGIGG